MATVEQRFGSVPGGSRRFPRSYPTCMYVSGFFAGFSRSIDWGRSLLVVRPATPAVA